jgi:uncharacterized protein (DUF362 family)
MGSDLTRSEFLKLMGLTAAGVALLPGEQLLQGLIAPDDAEAAVASRFPALSVAKGHSLNASHIAAVTRTALNNLGGVGRFVHKGDVVVVKPNIYGARVPANACTTNPTVVATVIRECFKAGAKKVKVLDYPCGGSGAQSYQMSGIGPAAKAAGATVLQMSPSRFKSYAIPRGKRIKQLHVYPDFVTANVLISVPIAKNHGGEQISMACKNLMGCTSHDGSIGVNSMHKAGTGQAIPDLVSFLKPDLCVMDAIRVRISEGPGGTDPGGVRLKYTVVAGADPIAIDAYGAKNFLGMNPKDIAQLINGHNMGLGQIDLSKVSLKKVSL